ncbi:MULTISPECIES: DUF4181 domain-containing protein [Virgibacillus]|nr:MULTISPECIES: DUF4181 domain-containing protein [Virgibacillus]
MLKEKLLLFGRNLVVMMNDGLGAIFLGKLILIIVIFLLSLFLFNYGIRKWLKVKRKKFFSYSHVNEKHERIDWIIRISFIFIFLFLPIINLSLPDSQWYLEPSFLMIIFINTVEITRSIMEWRYDSDENSYLFTISQLLFINFFIFFLFITNFFDWFI